MKKRSSTFAGFGTDPERKVCQPEPIPLSGEVNRNVSGGIDIPPRSEKWCFTGGTPVHIKGGICEIEFLEVGTEALSRCEFTGELAYKKITTVFQHHPADVLWISFSCEAEYELINGKPFSIIATAEHPFWIKNRGWTKVGDLQTGDEFLTNDGKLAIVDRVTDKGSQAVVYNIEVEEFHTYFVGEEGLWVHNKNTKPL